MEEIKNKVEETNFANSFELLSSINVNDRVREKIGLKYLSWADAWGVLKKHYPDSSLQVYSRKEKIKETSVLTDEITHMTKTIEMETENEIPYFTDGKTCYVKVGVTIDGVEYIEIYPIMNNKNGSVPISMVTMTDVNKSIQRAFVKACARHGLGLYIYAGEDLPEADRKPPINFAEVEVQVNKYEPIELAEGAFLNMKRLVIEKIQANAYSPEVSSAITSFAGNQLKGKRLSQLDYADENDKVVLQRIDKYLTTVEGLM